MKAHEFAELESSGLLWYLNRVVFFRHGFTMMLVRRDDGTTAWTLVRRVIEKDAPVLESLDNVDQLFADLADRL